MIKRREIKIFDKQNEVNRSEIVSSVDHWFESPEVGFENIILNGTHEDILREYALLIVNDERWPADLAEIKPTEKSTIDELRNSLNNSVERKNGFGFN